MGCCEITVTRFTFAVGKGMGFYFDIPKSEVKFCTLYRDSAIQIKFMFCRKIRISLTETRASVLTKTPPTIVNEVLYYAVVRLIECTDALQRFNEIIAKMKVARGQSTNHWWNECLSICYLSLICHWYLSQALAQLRRTYCELLHFYSHQVIIEWEMSEMSAKHI